MDVSVAGDTDVETDETLTWKWGSYTNALLASYTYTGTIKNDDHPGITLSASPSSVAEDAGDTTVTVTATRAASRRTTSR